MAQCRHADVRANTKTAHDLAENGSHLTYSRAYITLTCSACGEPFGFVGVPIGTPGRLRASVTPDYRTLALPLYTPEQLADMGK